MNSSYLNPNVVSGSQKIVGKGLKEGLCKLVCNVRGKLQWLVG
jgi:hypothetical protein